MGPSKILPFLKFFFGGLFFFGLVVYFFCFHSPPFKLTPQRVGWTLPPEMEVPMCCDGRYVDHLEIFELLHPELHREPTKNGWRKILMAVDPEIFRREWMNAVDDHLHPLLEFHLHGINTWEGVNYRADMDMEIHARWHAMWERYCRRMAISPVEFGTHTISFPHDEIQKAVGEAIIQLAREYARQHPEIVNQEPDEDGYVKIPGRGKMRLSSLGESEDVEKDSPYAELKLPASYVYRFFDQFETDAWRVAKYSAMKQWSAAHDDFLNVVEEAARAEFYFPIFCREAPEIPLWTGEMEITEKLHRVIRFALCARASRRLENGDVNGAVTDLETLLRLGRHLYRSPGLYGYCAGKRMMGDAGFLLTEFLSSHPFSEAEIEKLWNLWNEPFPNRTPAERIVRWRLLLLDTLQRGQYWWGYDLFRWITLDKNLALDLLAPCLEKIDSARTPEDLVPEEALFFARDSRYRWGHDECPPSFHENEYEYLFTRGRTRKFMDYEKHGFWMASGAAWAEWPRSPEADVETSWQIARVALAVERFRMKTGDYPPTLAALVPEYLDAVPRDPYQFAGPIKYRNEETQVVIYSVGWDETDHGGVYDENEEDWVESVRRNVFREETEYDDDEEKVVESEPGYDVLVRIKKRSDGDHSTPTPSFSEIFR